MLVFITTTLCVLLLLLFKGIYNLAYIKVSAFGAERGTERGSGVLYEAFTDLLTVLVVSLHGKKDLQLQAKGFKSFLTETIVEDKKDASETIH